MDAFFIFGAEYFFFLSLLIALLVFVKLPKDEKRQMILLALLSSVLALIFAFSLRAIIENPRPFVVGGFEPLVPHEPDNGFPSDHTLLVATIAAVVGFFHRRAALYLWFIALVVGISRVYVGVHHFTDVIGSILISFVTALIAYATIATWKHKNRTNF